MRNTGRILLGVIAIVAAGQARAAVPVKPAEISRYIRSDSPYGHASYTTLFFNVYDVTLWTDAATWSQNKPFALTIAYHMHLTSRGMVDRSIAEMQYQQPLAASEKASYSATLSRIFPEVHSGDVITDMYIPAKGSIFYLNGRMIGTITDDAFAQRFLNIWLSPHTSDPRLRAQLLNRRNP